MDIAFSSLLATVSLILFCVYLVSKWKREFQSEIPGFQEIMFLGNINIVKRRKNNPKVSQLAAFQDVLAGLTLIHRKSGLFRFRLGFKNYVVLTSPETAHAMLSHRTELQKGTSYDSAIAYLGSGLITSVGDDKWRLHRKLLTPSFHTKALHELYLPSMDSHSRKLGELLNKKSDKEFVDISDMVDMCTFDIIMEAGVGVNMNAQEIRDVQFQSMIKMLTETWVKRPLKPWLMNETIFKMTAWGKEFYKNVDGTLDFVKKVVDKKRLTLEKTNENEDNSFGKRKKAFLDLLLNEQRLNKDSFTDRELIDEANTFIAAGYDTTSYSTSWALYLIGLYPEVQEKIHEELDSIFGTDIERPITPEDISELKYLESVIKETMRLYPSIPMIVRELQEDMILDGKRILKGTSILIYIWSVHRHPDYYEKPEVFNPDRNFPEKAFIPFSAGLRNCIGQKFGILEVKVLLANILRQVKIKSLDQRDKVIYVPGVVARPADQLRLKIESRYPG